MNSPINALTKALRILFVAFLKIVIINFCFGLAGFIANIGFCLPSSTVLYQNGDYPNGKLWAPLDHGASDKPARHLLRPSRIIAVILHSKSMPPSERLQ